MPTAPRPQTEAVIRSVFRSRCEGLPVVDEGLKDANAARARQVALQKQAEIPGYPDVDAYLKAKAIESGQNPYQPTYVAPQAG